MKSSHTTPRSVKEIDEILNIEAAGIFTAFLRKTVR